MTRHRPYPSDLSDARWELIEPTIAGRKRHIGVDTLGPLPAVRTSTASVSDNTGDIRPTPRTRQTFDRCGGTGKISPQCSDSRDIQTASRGASRARASRPTTARSSSPRSGHTHKNHRPAPTPSTSNYPAART